jgi:ABC-type dipeptide transport system, periplasmic component
MALLAQKNLAEIGVDMQLESVTFEEFNRRIGSGEFDAVVIEFVAGNSASRPYTFWYSESKRNVWGYRNREMDSALDEIRTASDETGYRRAFAKFQVQSIEDPPAIFLALGEVTRAVSTRFQVAAAPGVDILSTISSWQLATRATPSPN